MRGTIVALGVVLLATVSGVGCGEDDPAQETLKADEEAVLANPVPPFQKIAVCPVPTGQTTGATATGPQGMGPSMTGTIATAQTATGVSTTGGLVCGRNGKTYSDVCAAGGPANVAHLGGCADFVCNGSVCPAGSTCRSPSGPGTPYHCVMD
jgi:hypothetical protein